MGRALPKPLGCSGAAGLLAEAGSAGPALLAGSQPELRGRVGLLSARSGPAGWRGPSGRAHTHARPGSGREGAPRLSGAPAAGELQAGEQQAGQAGGAAGGAVRQTHRLGWLRAATLDWEKA
jgi:hypothetical protein